MKYSYTINLVLFLIFLFCFVLVTFTGINKDAFIYINSAAAHLSPVIWANLTFMGDTLTACVIMFLFIRKRPDLVWSGIIATILATLIVNVLKSYLNFPRPAAIISSDQIHIIGPVLLSHSFPSGHTVTIFTLAGILMYRFRSPVARISIILLALLIGLSRIAVGAHWPSDVYAGASIGLLCAVAGIYSVRSLGWNRNKWMQLLTGLILIVSVIYLLFFYRSGYDQAICLQYFIAFAVLAFGLREYYFLLKVRQ